MSLSGDVQEIVRRALAEDVGKGDITTKATVADDAQAIGKVIARKAGVLAGSEVFGEVFRQVDFLIAIKSQLKDGDSFDSGAEVMTIRGYAEGILTGERTALNFLC